MLGVRRVGVTAAAGELQRAGLITYHRGELRVLDRAGLERAACSCYAADMATYRQHLGSAVHRPAGERRARRPDARPGVPCGRSTTGPSCASAPMAAAEVPTLRERQLGRVGEFS